MRYAVCGGLPPGRLLTRPHRIAPLPLPRSQSLNPTIDEITTAVGRMNTNDILAEDIIQLKATVVSNENKVRDISKHIMDVAFDTVALMPNQISELLLRNNRENMKYINIIAMPNQNSFAIGAPKTIAQVLLANANTTIECEDGNVIQITFDRANDASAASKGSLFWCHITIGAYDPTSPADLKTAATGHVLALGFKATKFKNIMHKVAGTWMKKCHMDLEIAPDKRVDPGALCNTQVALPGGFVATINWGKDMRKHYHLCLGPCSRVIRTWDEWNGVADRTSTCTCRKNNGRGGKSKADHEIAANAIWERRLKKKAKTTEGAAGSGSK